MNLETERQKLNEQLSSGMTTEEVLSQSRIVDELVNESMKGMVMYEKI